jgi:hypothetical protein
MPDWRDDLPPIPSDRILGDVKREGDRRLELQQQRRNRFYAIGGSLAAAAALIAVVASGVFMSDDGDDDDAGATVAGTEVRSGTTRGAPSTLAETTTGGTTGATEAPATTDNAGAATTAAPGTSAAPATTEAAATTGAPATTEAAAATTIPSTPEVTLSHQEIWERPQGGGATCGFTTLEVTYSPDGFELASAQLFGARPGDEAMDMTIVGNRATASVGPFDAGTLPAGTQRELPLYVRWTDRAGRIGFVRPSEPAVLNDCSP